MPEPVGTGRVFRERVLAGEPLVGTFVNLGSSVSAEICALAGFDWLLIDLEHGSGSQADLVGQLQAVARTGTTPIVRVELPARTPVSRALDPGAERGDPPWDRDVPTSRPGASGGESVAQYGA